MTDNRKWTCDNCPYRGVATREWSRPTTVRVPASPSRKRIAQKRDAGEEITVFDEVGLAMMAPLDRILKIDGEYWEETEALGPEDYDACFFNPVPVECPPQNWCGRHPKED